MSKKIIFLIFILLIIIGILFGYAYFFGYKDAPTDPTTGEKPSFFSFLPFSLGDGFNNSSSTADNLNPNNADNSDNPLNNNPSQFVPRLRQISNTPTAGYLSFERKATSTLDVFATVSASGTKATSTASTTETVVNYMERATGHIYETVSTLFTNERILNQTIPKVYNTLFNQKGNALVAQTLTENNEIKSLIAIKSKATSTESRSLIIETKLEGYPLPIGIKNIVTSPKKDKVFYISEIPTGSLGFVRTFTPTNSQQIFSSPLSEWIATWPKDDTITLTSNASHQAPGILMFLNAKTGAAQYILRNILGLTTLTNTDTSTVLYSESKPNTLLLYSYDIKKNQKIELGIKTLPEKCVWSQKNVLTVYCAVPESLPYAEYPDTWYKGSISFNDELWKIDLTNGETKKLLVPEREGRVSIDMINLSLSEKENFIYFINKKDLTLWSYQLQ